MLPGQDNDAEPEVFEALDGVHKTVEVDRFLDVAVGAHLVTLVNVALVGGRRKDQDRYLPEVVDLLNLFQDLAAVGAWQIQVEKDEAGPWGLCSVCVLAALIKVIEGIVAVLATTNRIGQSGLTQSPHGGLEIFGAVFHEQDGFESHADSPARVNLKVVPSPKTDSTQIRPPWARLFS